MYRLISAIVIILVIGKLCHTTGFEWIPLNSGDPIPEKAVLIDLKYEAYVGRARHYNSVLPAEVYNSTDSYARISSCSKEIVKNQFEVLVATEKCEWKKFTLIEDVPENVVRAGAARNGEPIFIGKTMSVLPNERRWDYDHQEYIEDYSYLDIHIASILLTTNQVIEWNDIYSNSRFTLICEDNNKWVDTSSAQIPNNTISGGKSEDDNEIFVARLLNNCTVVPGQVIPELGIATAVYGGNELHAPFCQVLVGDSEKYSWVLANNGEIPDYAVVAGKYENKNLMYVARVNKTVGYILYKEVLTYHMDYEILVRNIE